LRNKLLFLLPIALILSVVAPWSITPLLMLGGGYLCFEGAEKAFGKFFHPHEEDPAAKQNELVEGSPKEVEDAKVAGAIRTDFILSAEIMAISLASIDKGGFWMRAVVLAIVAVAITVAVYGAVALIVKADDVGVRLSEQENALARKLGIGLVKAMPGFLKGLTVFGTAAMLWVGGGIILHGLEELGWGGPAHFVHHWAEEAAHAVSGMAGFVEWFVSALGGLVAGLLVGLALIPLVTKCLGPLTEKVRAGKGSPESAESS
ncbi:MAG: DUF808 domain-containing protein, partial [Verrucomicrobiota bacterium]